MKAYTRRGYGYKKRLQWEATMKAFIQGEVAMRGYNVMKGNREVTIVGYRDNRGYNEVTISTPIRFTMYLQ